MLKNLLTFILLLTLTSCDRWPKTLRRTENEALKYYWETEADNNDVEAAYLAAKTHCCGPDTFKNDIEALNLFCTAAKEGHRASMFEIGKMYGDFSAEKFTAIPQDNALAFTFLSMAEQNGFEHASSYRKEILNEISDEDFLRATKLIENYPNIPCEITR